MNILNEMDIMIEEFMLETNKLPGLIIVGAKTAEKLTKEIGVSPVTVRGIPINVDLQIAEETIAIFPEEDEETLKTECICGYMSYENGYCPDCGRYRGVEETEEHHADLVELMGNEDEALRYGFSIVGEE